MEPREIRTDQIRLIQPDRLPEALREAYGDYQNPTPTKASRNRDELFAVATVLGNEPGPISVTGGDNIGSFGRNRYSSITVSAHDVTPQQLAAILKNMAEAVLMAGEHCKDNEVKADSAA